MAKKKKSSAKKKSAPKQQVVPQINDFEQRKREKLSKLLEQKKKIQEDNQKQKASEKGFFQKAVGGLGRMGRNMAVNKAIARESQYFKDKDKIEGLKVKVQGAKLQKELREIQGGSSQNGFDDLLPQKAAQPIRLEDLY